MALVGIGLGAAIWLGSPLLVGFQEPWDAPRPYYAAALAITGALVGALAPARWWLAAPALILGQFLVFSIRALLTTQELWLLGVISLVLQALYALCGSVVGALAVTLLRRANRAGRSTSSPDR